MDPRVMYLFVGGGAAVLGACVLVVFRVQQARARKRVAEAQARLAAARSHLAQATAAASVQARSTAIGAAWEFSSDMPARAVKIKGSKPANGHAP
jgi:hypothetical protein